MNGTPNPTSISTKLERIAKLSKDMPGVPLRTLAHHIDIDWLREAYRRTRKDGAAGVDGTTAAEYEQHLDENLRQLLGRAKSGYRYRAPPVRRVHIPKGDGRSTRPIGVPTFEDKILQKAVAMVLEAVYEQDFLDCSFGFRPGRGAHDALDMVARQTMRMQGGWVLEADIESFFDSVDHAQLREVLQQRVHDGVLLRLIGKWLNAGVMEEGVVRYPDSGTPQGGVISPLLANIFLHEVLDMWFERDVVPRLWGEAALVRYADDFVIVFEQGDDARRVQAVLGRRLEKYGLRLHPAKTRLFEFKPPRRGSDGPRSGGKAKNSFDFLGFTHYWAVSRKGRWGLRKKTSSARFSRTMKRIAQWCSRFRHAPVRWQHEKLCRMLRGHDAYFGVVGNYKALDKLRWWTINTWWKWLRRRSRSAIRFASMAQFAKQFALPPPRWHRHVA